MDLVVASIPSIDSNEPIIKIIPTNCSVVKVDKNGEFIYGYSDMQDCEKSYEIY